jgi:hypothetical protein
MRERKDTLVPIANSAIAQILRAISPPTTLVHVGWGNGMGDLTQWTQWQVPNAFVIEAEERKAEASQAQALALAQTLELSNKPWQTIRATLSAQNAEQTYHLASNPTESGLLPPDSLQHAWPHLQAVATQTVTTRSLDELWPDITLRWPVAQSAGNIWFIIDCLPAADVLSGGCTVLQAAHVVCARSLLANRVLLSEQMRSAGWIEVGWVESQHPAFGHAWFTRDTALALGNAAKRHAQLEAERDAITKAKEAETAAMNQALAERDALAQAKTELTSQLDALEKAIADSRAQLGINTQAQTDLKGQLSAITQAQVELQSELQETSKRHEQLKTERDALAKAKEAETSAKNKALAERDELGRAKAIALQERDASINAKEKDLFELTQRHEKEISRYQEQVVQEKKSRTDLQRQFDQTMGKVASHQLELQSLHSKLESQNSASTQLAHRTAELAQLQVQLLEAQKRQMLMNDALLKSEAQIELIKDLCLREPGI